MNRREFITGGVGAALAAGGCSIFNGDGVKYKLAMAGYTLNSFKLEPALEICRKNGIRHLCVKSFHLPLTATAAEIAAFRRKCADYDVAPYGAGPIYMATADEMKRCFDYTAALGVDVLVGVPGRKRGDGKVVSDRAMCEHASRLAAEYDIKFAIHNHGRNPKTGNPLLYPAVPETWELIRDLDRRVGFCVDWAYSHADGLDCPALARTYAPRIFDGHVRCISDAANGSSGVNPAGRAFDYDGIFAALKEIGYDGCLGLELANAFPDHPEWIAESCGYFRGLMV
ncbi:MAG: sugar phosphate isomerase/epimerase [Kiritimatiellae bacterium]|nr:sugar phosphate isomerase/epimerase [Kiritimatiellia bacterium]